VNLIVVSDLTTKEGLYFRYLTMTAKSYLEMDVVVEARKEQIDYYYKLLKKKGLYDFVSEIVPPEYEVDGIRLAKYHSIWAFPILYESSLKC
jgi:hypothetical protein